MFLSVENSLSRVTSPRFPDPSPLCGPGAPPPAAARLCQPAGAVAGQGTRSTGEKVSVGRVDSHMTFSQSDDLKLVT